MTPNPTSGGGSDHVRHALAFARDRNRTAAGRWLRIERGVADLALEHEPFRLEGALRLLDEESRRELAGRDAAGRRDGPEPELVWQGCYGKSGADPRAVGGRVVARSPRHPSDGSGGSLAPGVFEGRPSTLW